VVIPFVEGGRIQFMTGRTILGKEPKYLHLPNTAYAWKVPYNRRTSAKDVVVVEGTLDVWAVEALAGDGVGQLR
jgi:DNA primase